jgi:hypothetical protein
MVPSLRRTYRDIPPLTEVPADRLKRNVAIKVFTAQFSERFEREAQAMVDATGGGPRIRVPGIVRDDSPRP